jgi:hypothetical protein
LIKRWTLLSKLEKKPLSLKQAVFLRLFFADVFLRPPPFGGGVFNSLVMVIVWFLYALFDSAKNQYASFDHPDSV